MDVMPTDASVLGFGNRWLAPGYSSREPFRLPSGRYILRFALPYAFVSKIAAFEDRGAQDPYLSWDLEDLIALLDGAPTLLDALRAAAPDVRQTCAEFATALLARSRVTDLIDGHLPRGPDSGPRADAVLRSLREMTGWA